MMQQQNGSAINLRKHRYGQQQRMRLRASARKNPLADYTRTGRGPETRGMTYKCNENERAGVDIPRTGQGIVRSNTRETPPIDDQ